MAYITLDFGSSNSGAVLNPVDGTDYNPSDLIYVHLQDGDSNRVKQPTVFWIERSLLNQGNISLDDINIYSSVFYEDDYIEDANFIWCKRQIRNTRKKLADEGNNWIKVEYPKMELYRNNGKDLSLVDMTTNDGSKIRLSKVLQIFFNVIKKECLHTISERGLAIPESEIKWAMTMPGMAIWHQNAVDFLREITKPIFGDDLLLLSEPESALVGINITGRTDLNFVDGRYSLVVDLGGGTADICVMKETKLSDGCLTFEEIKTTEESHDATTSTKAGGNDIDAAFKQYFCNILSIGMTLDDSPVKIFYNDFCKGNPVGAIDFDEAWEKLRTSEMIEDEEIDFYPGRHYLEWIKINYPEILSKFDFTGGILLDGNDLRVNVFEPTFNKIKDAVSENLHIMKAKGLTLDSLYFAGGLSLLKMLKKEIKDLTQSYFPIVNFREMSEGSVIGAIQRGGNHIAVNNRTLIQRMSRKTYYVRFAWNVSGNMDNIKQECRNLFRAVYYNNKGVLLSDSQIEEILKDQWKDISIDTPNGIISFLSPAILRFTPVSKASAFKATPILKGQTSICIKLYSSDSNTILFPCDKVSLVGEISHEFGYPWDNVQIIFDPTTNPLSGNAQFKLCDSDGNVIKEITIHNVSKRGL